MPTTFTYADPRVCPSCRQDLPDDVAADHRCATCAVPLGHPLAVEVYAALQRTDSLVARLRAAATAPPPRPGPVPQPQPVPQPVPQAVPWTPAGPLPRRTGVRGSSVPAILLGLGALCLLVAAVTFLAVAWSWLGVGGRTLVLATLTLATAVAGKALEARGLRVTAEALVTIALGLLLLDVVGAERAGWFAVGDAALALVLGLALAAGGVVLAPGPRRLAAPQTAVVLGLLVAQAALPSLVGHALVVAALATAGLMALAVVVRDASDLRVLKWAAVAAAVVTWSDLTLSALAGVAELDALTVPGLWGGAAGPALLAAALLLLTPVALSRDNALLQVAATASATMLTCLVALPVLDDGAGRVALASLVAAGLWTAVAHVVPRSLLTVPAVPAALSLLPGAGVALVLAGQAVESALTPTPALRLDPTDPVASPLLLVPTALVAVALLAALVPSRGSAARGALVRTAAAVALLAGAATLALHPAPLWTLVAVLTLATGAHAADALSRDDAGALVQALGAGLVLVSTLPVASASTALLLAPLAVLAAAAVAALLVGRFPAAVEIGALALPPALAALTWVLGDLAGLDATRAVPVLVVLTAVAVARPRVELEFTASAAGAVAVLAAVQFATDEPLSTALHLTLAGSLVVVHALLHASRRPLAWVGSGLLLLASWVRLTDIGADAPELYTMPAALALLLVGLHRIHRDEHASTALALLPGLVLATLPSFVHVASHDPVSLRAALLGLGCLVLAVGGAQLRWSAPLLVGATVGGLLTLVELAPYAAETPQWVVIGVAGTVLVVAGTTWERRVVDLQRAATYVVRLR